MAMPRRRLQDRRIERGLTQAQLADTLHVSTETVASWERGTATPRTGFRPALARALGVSLDALAALIDGEPPAPDGHVVPEWLDTYVSLEQGAARIWAYEPLVIHGLLQTRAYAEAVEGADPRLRSDGHVIEQVGLRMVRQQALHRETDPLRLSIVIDESALHRVAGDRLVMAEQLDHLVATPDTVTIQVLPFAAGVFASAWGGFSLLASSGDTPTLAFVENRTGVSYLSRAFEIEEHRDLYQHLSEVALPPAESLDLIRTIAKERYR